MVDQAAATPNSRRARRLATIGSLLLVVVAVAACQSQPPIRNAADVVAALQKAGIVIESQEPAPQPKGGRVRFDEGVRLKGTGFEMDVLRIDDDKVYDIATKVGPLLAMAEAKAGSEIPGKPDIHYSKPFIIVVRRNPDAPDVAAALQGVLPPDGT